MGFNRDSQWGVLVLHPKLCSIRREEKVVYTNDSGLAAWLEVDG